MLMYRRTKTSTTHGSNTPRLHTQIYYQLRYTPGIRKQHMEGPGNRESARTPRQKGPREELQRLSLDPQSSRARRSFRTPLQLLESVPDINSLLAEYQILFQDWDSAIFNGVIPYGKDFVTGYLVLWQLGIMVEIQRERASSSMTPSLHTMWLRFKASGTVSSAFSQEYNRLVD